MRILIMIIASLATICAVTTAAVQTASTKTNATKPIINPSKSTHLKDVRKRQLDEYGNYINSPYNSNVYHSPITGPIFQRRISTGNGGGYSLHEPRSYFPSSNFYEQNSLFTNNNNNNYDQHSIPSYAVQMEPLTQYSQRDPFNPGFIEHNSYSGGGGGSGLSYGPQQNIRYIEAPEPIIEIIIKDSNDSLPAQHLSIPLPAVPKKHKKEQVQVFYVKYKKDEHKGLIIEDPIPALSPTAYHQENQDEDDAHHEEHGSYEVTTPSSIPLKTTTLRTIIHPDSEKYHSNSGIQVTFNTESKHGLNNGQQYQEHIEESALQPVITDVNPRNFPSNVGVNRGPSSPQSPQSSQHQQQYPSQYHLNQFQQDEQFRSHRYDGEQFNNYQQQRQQQQQQRRPAFHQELPFQNSPYQPFRSGGPPEQHHHQHQQQQQQQQQFNSNRFYQTQHHDHRQFGIVDQPPQQQQHPSSQTPPFDTSNRNFENVRFPSPNEFVQQNNNHHQQQQQFHQPRPIPIPIHNEPPPAPLPSSSSSSFGQIQTQFHPQTQATFNKFNQFENRPPSQQQFNGPPSFNRKPSHPPPPPPRPQQSQPQQQQQQFQRPPQPQRINEQKFTHLKPIQQFSTNNQQQPQHLHPINQSPFSHPSGPPPPPPPPPSSSRPIIPSQQQQQQQFNRNQYSEYQQHQQHQQQFQQNYQSNFQPNFNINNGQNSFHSDNLNNIAPGAELIESVPKFETHITETVPISQINQPFLSGSSSQQQQQRQQQQSFQSTVQPYQQQQQQQHPLSNDEFLKQDIQYASVQTNLLTSPQPTRPTTYSSSTVSNLDNNNKNGALSREQYRDEIHQQFIKYVDDYPQASPSPHLQIIPNSAPIQQKLIPGQSVSNLATEVFPSFERQQQQYFSQATAATYHQQQQQNHQQEQLVVPLSGRHNNNNINNNNNKVTVEQTISVTQKPSQYYPSSTQRQQSTIDYHKSVTPSSAKSLSSSSSSITANHIVSSTTAKPPTVKPKSKQKIELPDEVPDDLRAQLLSSGILDNADISILDYDKIGDVDLANLPPEHLANFYGAGGASQIASSNKILTVVKPNGDRIIDLKLKTSDLTNKKASQLDEHKNQKSLTPTTNKKHNVDLKVVRFDSNNQKSITDKYIKYDSTVLPSVSITNPEQLQQQQQQQYNRYLPLKVNGAQFPIPDVSELKGKRISSVVVLAPVDNLQSVESYDDEADASNAAKRSANEGRSISSNNRGRTNDNDDYSSSSSGESRVERDIIDSKHVKFIAGDTLKQLLKKPTKDNFKKWLDKESKTDIDLQSVVLLVTRNANDEQEIFMYDIVSHKVNKLKGELSSAFVNVAESNANADDIDNGSISDSGILEKMIAKPKAAAANDENSANENFDNGSSSQSSSSIGINNRQQTANRKNHQLTINSGYSAIKS